MPRRRSSDDEGVSLFPFMSILACLIGILTLMISVVMQLKEMDRDKLTQVEYDRAVENRGLRKRIEDIEKELPKIDERMKKERSTAAEMEKLKDRQIVLKQKMEELQKAKDLTKTDVELQKIAEILKMEITALKSERPPLNKQLAKLQEELKKRKETPKPEESVVVRPGGIGSRTARNLFFVECTSTGIVLHEKEAKPFIISKAAIPSNDKYAALLENVKRTRDSMVLYLVRKSGNDSYLWAAGTAESKYEVNTGKLPIPNEGKIDLTLFDD